MRISDWSSDVCSSDLLGQRRTLARRQVKAGNQAVWRIGDGAGIEQQEEIDPERIPVGRADVAHRNLQITLADAPGDAIAQRRAKACRPAVFERHFRRGAAGTNAAGRRVGKWWVSRGRTRGVPE